MFRDGPERLLVFRVGAERFATRLAAVDEVIDMPAAQPLPDARGAVLGIATVRDELVPLFDAATLLQVTGAGHGAALLFVRGERRVGLAIDDVFDAVLVEEAELRPAPGIDAEDGVLLGVVRRGNDLISVLDAEALLDAATAVTEGGNA